MNVPVHEITIWSTNHGLGVLTIDMVHQRLDVVWRVGEVGYGRVGVEAAGMHLVTLTHRQLSEHSEIALQNRFLYSF